jgi:hypothetical protein
MIIAIENIAINRNIAQPYFGCWQAEPCSTYLHILTNNDGICELKMFEVKPGF